MNTITVEELKARHLAGDRPILLDVRSPTEYARVHAAGAMLLPLDEIDAASIPAALLATDRPMHVLCHSGTRAALACEKLSAIGVRQPVRVDGGTVAWENASMPVIRAGRNVISLERQVRIAAGSLVLLGILLGWIVQQAFIGISIFVGAGLIFAGITDFCGMGILLMKMPWNRVPSKQSTG